MKMHRFALGLILAVHMGFALPALADQFDTASPEQLRQWLKQYPQADTNKDGVLTPEEARAYYWKLQKEREAARKAEKPTFRHEYCFATMSDGVRIALAIGYPRDFNPKDTERKWAAILCTCGYPLVTVPIPPAQYRDHFVTVAVSIRGSGASGGVLSPWRPRTWQDGQEVIENWIVKQPWSNGKVGIDGYSWPGLMGFLTATTQLPSLKAVSVGGLVDDFYRGICYVGGVRNCGFPVDWLNSFYRPDGVFGSDRAAQAARGLDEAAFQTIVKGRPAPDLTQDTLWHLLQVPFDGPSWREQSLCTYAARIRAPIIIGHAWQDEQTGPTGWKLWKRIPDDVPKRLFCTNGHHGVGPTPHHAVLAWFDHWLLDQPGPDAWYPASRVSCYFETPNPEKEKTKGRNEPLVAADFPASETRWTRYFLRGQGQLSLSLPSEDMPGRYLVTHSRSHNKDHWVGYELAFKEPTAICGPAILNLWAKLTTIDTDFFVLLADQAPDGSLFGLQRGLLRASHREINPKKSTYLDLDGQKVLLQPFHPHEQARPVRPNEPQQYQIEIPAVGHVFRPGHKLVLILTQPPEGDPIGVTRDGHPSYRYDSHPPPGTVTILHKAGQPSSLLLPVLPMLPPLSADPVPLEKQAGLQPVR